MGMNSSKHCAVDMERHQTSNTHDFCTKLSIVRYGYNHAISIVALVVCVDSNHMEKYNFGAWFSCCLTPNKKKKKSKQEQDQKVQIMESRNKYSIRYTVSMYEILWLISGYIM